LKRVMVTGMAAWSSLGRTLAEYAKGLREGASGCRPVTRLDVSSPAYRTRNAAQLANEEYLEVRVDETRIADLSISVAVEALCDAALSANSIDPQRLGVALGTSHGGNIAFMKLVRGRLGLASGRIDHRLLLSNSSTIVGQIAHQLGACGPTATISTACASGTNSIGRAADWIRTGRADVMLAGGADLFTELSFSGFNILGAMTRDVCRPLDRDRDGMMLGDAAAMLVLESEEHARKRGARIWAIIAGHAIANDAFHATGPEPEANGIARVMKDALANANLTINDIDYINLHGTGTPANDSIELRGIERVFAARAKQILMSSTKSQLGHTLGAAGSVEIVATILGMSGGWAPPSINLRAPIDGFEDWSFVRDRAKPANIRAAISNSFGFAGHLACIVIQNAHNTINGAAR